TAADHVVVNPDLAFVDARRLCGLILSTPRHLGSAPYIDRVRPHMDCAVDGLHWCVSKERKLIDGIEPYRDSGDRCCRIASSLRDNAGTFGCITMAFDDVGLRDRGVRTEIPLDIERLEALLRRPEVVTHDRDAVRQPQDRYESFGLLRRTVIDVQQL